MSDEKKGKGFLKSLSELSFIKKLKSIKHIEIIIVVIFILLLLLICFSGSETFGFLKKTSSQTNTSIVSTYYFDTNEYVLMMENKLKNVLSQIKNSGKVEVMISVDDSAMFTFATNDIVTTSGQTTSQEKKVILIDSDGKSVPIVIGEKPPNINGIVVVSSGASDTKVKLDIISAVQTLLDIDSSKIQVFVGN